MLLIFHETWLPMALHPVSVDLLTIPDGGEFLFARSQAVVLAIVATTRWHNVLGNVAGWLTFDVTWTNDLTAQDFACQLANGRLVHGEGCFAPQLASWSKEVSLGYNARATDIPHILAMLPAWQTIAGVTPVCPLDLVAASEALGQCQFLGTALRFLGNAGFGGTLHFLGATWID